MKKTIFTILVFYLLTVLIVSCSAQTTINRIFGVGMGVIGIVTNDKIQFYQQSGDTWETDSDDDFTLPKGYKGLFSPGLGVVGIVTNDKIQFYQQSGDTWETDPDNDFML